MLKVIIADDEIWVCKLIEKLVKWEEVEMELVGTATDGIEAYKLIEDKNPDIVITDIRMPGMDGVSLVSKAREMNYKCSFIIISGYKDFEYAQKALKLGVEDYILKPIDEEELINTLVRIGKSIISSRMQLAEKDVLEKQLVSSMDKLREQFMQKVLITHDVSIIDKEKVNLEYNFRFADGIFIVVILQMDGNLNNMISSKILSFINEYFKTKCYDTYTFCQESRVICILNFPLENANMINDTSKEMFYKIRETIQLFPNLSLTAGIGTREREINGLKKSFEAAVHAVRCRIISGTDRIIDFCSLKHENQVDINNILKVEKEKQFVCMIEVFDVDGVKEWIRQAFQPYTHHTGCSFDPSPIFHLTYKIVETFYSVVGSWNSPVEGDCISKKKILEDIDKCKSVTEIAIYLSKVLAEVLECYRSNYEYKHVKKPVEMIKKYISKHYSEAINLDDVANMVYLNSNYLSDMFKKETGMNFKDYIINYRIEVAKDLLKDIKYKTYEVAEMVGYKDPKYFCKLFKKVIGINPKQYKKLYM